MEFEISGRTELTGLFAKPVRHSNSPKMHNEAFRLLGIDCRYLAFEVDQSALADAVQSVRALGMRGVNVSMPNKTAVLQYLDRLSPAAELCGAVNTIVNENGVLTGHITDGTGYVESLRDAGFEPKGQKLTVMGAGSAGTAIAIQLALDGAKELSIFNIRDKFWENAHASAKKINTRTGCKATVFDLDDKETLRREIADSAVLANATCVGMKPLEGLCVVPDASFFRPELIVTDAIYAPPATPLLQMAKSAGCRVMNGLPMMLFQGDAAFRLWTGQAMPIDAIKDILGIQH